MTTFFNCILSRCIPKTAPSLSRMTQSHYLLRSPLPPNTSTCKTRLPQTKRKTQSRVLSLIAVRWSYLTTSTITLISTPQRHYLLTRPRESITLIIHPATCKGPPLYLVLARAHPKPPAQTTVTIQISWAVRGKAAVTRRSRRNVFTIGETPTAARKVHWPEAF